jgi:hypothetical protein
MLALRRVGVASRNLDWLKAGPVSSSEDHSPARAATHEHHFFLGWKSLKPGRCRELSLLQALARITPLLVLALALASPAACGGSASQGGGAGGGAAADAGGASGSGGLAGASGSGGSAGSAGNAGESTGATGGATDAGGGGGIDLDGAVLEGSLDVVSCTPNTSDSDCGTFPQCGCSVGEKCDVVALDTGRAACVSDGSVLPNQACGTLFGQCTAGNTCVGGACKPFCATAADCPGAGRECDQTQATLGGQTVSVPGMFTCTAGCDPINPGVVCGGGITCLFVSATSTDCYSAGSGVGPGACSANQGLACAPGNVCIDTTAKNGTYSCLGWCRLSANDCPATYACQELSTKPTLSGVEYGACFPP